MTATTKPSVDTTQRIKQTILDRLASAQDVKNPRWKEPLAEPYAVEYARYLLGDVKVQPHPKRFDITPERAKELRTIVKQATPDKRTVKTRKKAKTPATKTRPVFSAAEIDMLREAAQIECERLCKEYGRAKDAYEAAHQLVVKLGGPA